MYKTHLIFGLLAGIISLKYLNVNNEGLFLFLCTIAALFPDIDHNESYLGKRIKWLSSFIMRVFGHRGFFHSVFPVLILFLIFYYFGYSEIGYALGLGYLSHLLIDSITLEGINFLHPFSKFRISGFVKTGGLLEIIIFVILLIVLGWIVYFKI